MFECYRELKINMTEEEINVKIDEIWEKIDNNQSGKIEYSEYILGAID